MDKIEGIPTIIQALIGKFYFTKTEPDTTWLIGDLDLYPLQQFHFKEYIKDIDEDKYVHLNPYAYGTGWRNSINGLAGYFHVAKGRIFEKELNFVGKSFQESTGPIWFLMRSYYLKVITLIFMPQDHMKTTAIL